MSQEVIMNHIRFNIVSAFFFLLILGCSIKAPEVRVTGEKTALEREVIGTYHQMREDTWMIASTRSVAEDTTADVSPEKKQVLEALREQEYNKDDIDEFKRKGYVGENNQSFLDIRPSESLESDAETKKLVEEIVSEENRDREAIMGRVIELNESLKKAVREEVLVIFARMHQENSPQGTWVQQPEGKWIKK
jgi:uncharacterized protein YdbL (DUF1318 family)